MEEVGTHQGHFAAMRAVGTLVLVGLAAGACSGEPTVGSIEAAVSSTAGATVTSASSVASTTPQTAGEVPPSSATSTSSTPVTTSTTEVDRTAPSLIVLSPEEGATFTQAEVRFEGSAESGASVRAWDRWAATVAADGTWSIVLILEPGTNVARFTATDAGGNTEVAERVVRYDPPAPPPTTTIAPPTPPPTTVIVFYPTEVPEEHRPGSCSFHSVSTWREDAYRCGVDEDVLNYIYDPCFDTGDHVVCDVSPIRAGPGFILDLTEPLPVLLIPDGVNPWILEFPDGVVCESAPGATRTIDGSRLQYSCTDGSWVLQNLRPGEVWTGHRVVIDRLSPPIVFDYGFTPIRRVWR